MNEKWNAFRIMESGIMSIGKEVLYMWTATTMSLGDSIILSGMGLLVVMAELSILAIAIIILSKIVGSAKKPAAAAPAAAKAVVAAAPAAVAAPALDEEAYAVLLAAASDASGLPLQSFQITSIKEIG